MSKKVVALRPRQKKGSTDAPKSLTLADIAITWTEGKSTRETRHYVTGQTLVQAIRYLRDRHPNTQGHDPLGEQAMVPTYLRGLSYIMFPDAARPRKRSRKMSASRSPSISNISAPCSAAREARGHRTRCT
jgi:hypothetical protein